jgi:ATP-dependent Clp endopeptidase proteolytic subunit ClpP
MTAQELIDNDASKDYLERLLLATQIEKVEAEKEKLLQEGKKFKWEAIREERFELVRAAESRDANIYTFSEMVSQKTVNEAMEKLGEFTRLADPDKPLEVVLNSPGGAVLDGLALYDYLRLLAEDRQVTVTALGTAASMGSVILQAGNTRRMGRNAWMLIHEVSKGAIGNVSELKAEAEFAESLWHTLSDILAERSTFTARQIRNKAKNKDWWLSSKEALQYGFVDEIV